MTATPDPDTAAWLAGAEHESTEPTGISRRGSRPMPSPRPVGRPRGRCAMGGAGDWAQRIGRHVLPDGSVVVPPRIAAWLKKQAGLNSGPRISVRDSDPLAYEVLAALHIAALDHRSGNGTKIVGQQHLPQELDVWLTTDAAAAQLRVTPRTVLKWIAAEKLPATRHGGRWLINRQHLNIIQALAASPKGQAPQCQHSTSTTCVGACPKSG
jgi:excisionase family DNA binding protein